MTDLDKLKIMEAEVLTERERCARIAESMKSQNSSGNADTDEGWDEAADTIAKKIREG